MTGLRDAAPTGAPTDAPPRPAHGPSAPAGLSAADAHHARAIGWEIFRLRTQAGLTQEQLAARCDMSAGTLRRWESGAVVLLNLHQLRALAAALDVTAGQLIDAGTGHPRAATGARPEVARGARSGFVLLPTRLPGTRHGATAWRLLSYPPYELGQRWERPQDTDPTRTVSPAILDWASDLLRTRAELFGSASELTGQRSWYIGPLHNPATGGTPGGTGVGVGGRA